jgi:hypothetical protein
MKKLRISLLIAVALLITAHLASALVGGDLAAVAPVAAVPVVEPVSFLLWAQQNLAALLGIALTISELMGSSPWFKGNGIIHSITVSLQFLMQKSTPAP